MEQQAVLGLYQTADIADLELELWAVSGLCQTVGLELNCQASGLALGLELQAVLGLCQTVDLELDGQASGLTLEQQAVLGLSDS